MVTEKFPVLMEVRAWLWSKLTRTENKNEKGFTLIELILVLSVVVIMTAIIMPVGGKWVRTTTEEDAIESIVATVYSIQSYAMAHRVYTRLSFIDTGSRTAYVAAAPGRIELSRKLLPEGMYVSDSSGLKEIEFHANGDIMKFGALTIVGKTGKTKITFQFQRGRMIISESKRTFMARSDPYPWGTGRYLWYIAAGRNEYDFNAS